MTLVGGYKHGHLRQVNVGVEIINKPKRDWEICTMPGGDETRCTKESKSEGGGKVSSRERDSVGPIAIVSGVDNKGNVIR